MPVLRVEGLSVNFRTAFGDVKAAEDVAFSLHETETLALVGETGCGKSVVINAILRLLPENARLRGRVIYKGRDMLQMNERSMSQIRGKEISIIFQNPSMALNPVYRVAGQVSECLFLKNGLSKNKARAVSRKVMGLLGLNGLEDSYPFQLSGGMNQRCMIACSLVPAPNIIIADEPTKGLDQNLVGEVLEEIEKGKELNRSSLLLITHDLGVAQRVSDRVAVMYCGEIVELGTTKEVLQDPHHPYTQALMNSLPDRGFRPIPGFSPSMINPPEGCKFHPRCPYKKDVCASKRPDLFPARNGAARCWLWI